MQLPLRTDFFSVSFFLCAYWLLIVPVLFVSTGFFFMPVFLLLEKKNWLLNRRTTAGQDILNATYLIETWNA